MNEKIKEHHLGKKALLYVRQSSQHQLLHNEESRRLQYGMQDRLRTLGWTEIEVIDEDLGRSAGGLVERSGFQKLVAEVSLGRVGAVAAREVSRFARNSRDWQQLVQICRVVDALLVDHETVYDARRGNDRLLLGLKGSLNEYELDLLRLRSEEAKREKARRGELVHQAAAGYQWTNDERLEKDPDLRVQRAIRLMFTKCKELGSVRQTMMWFREHGIEVPVSLPDSQAAAFFKRARYAHFLRVLRNPVYAGTYSWGKTVTTTSRDGATKAVRRRRKQQDWSVLIPNHHEAYVSHEEFDDIQKIIDSNAQSIYARTGAPKTGRALLAGLIRCRRCGHRLQVSYGGRHHPDLFRYHCVRGKIDQGEPTCISFNGVYVDDAIARAIFEVVQPSAIEAASRAVGSSNTAQDTLLMALQTELQAARYAANRAAKQFDAVDPENRLVANELEQRWNAALLRMREIEERIVREENARSVRVAPEPQQLEDVGPDLEHVWNAPESDVRLKKRIVRALIEEIITDVDGGRTSITVVIHWKGGVHTELNVPKRSNRDVRAKSPSDVVEAIRILSRVANDDYIAQALSRAGQRTPKNLKWTRERVAALRHNHGIERFSETRKKREGWVTLFEASQILNVAGLTLKRAVARGVVEATQPLINGPWVLKREDLNGIEPRVRIRPRPSVAGTASNAADAQNPAQLNLGISPR